MSFDVTPRFTADEAKALLEAAELFRKNFGTALSDAGARNIDGAINALIFGSSTIGDTALVKIGEVPPWMEDTDVRLAEDDLSSGRETFIVKPRMAQSVQDRSFPTYRLKGEGDS